MKLTFKIATFLTLILAANTAYASCEGRLPSNHQRVINPNRPDMQAFSASVRYYSNVARCRKGLSPLQADAALLDAAQGHSDYMADARVLSHTSNIRGERQLMDRVRKAGVSTNIAAENIAQNYLYDLVGRNISIASAGPCKFTDADTRQQIPAHSYGSLANILVNQWLGSSKHYKNLMSKRVGRMEAAFGVAADSATCGYVYITQDFAG